jgi:hypothetical protein
MRVPSLYGPGICMVQYLPPGKVGDSAQQRCPTLPAGCDFFRPARRSISVALSGTMSLNARARLLISPLRLGWLGRLLFRVQLNFRRVRHFINYETFKDFLDKFMAGISTISSFLAITRRNTWTSASSWFHVQRFKSFGLFVGSDEISIENVSGIFTSSCIESSQN